MATSKKPKSKSHTALGITLPELIALLGVRELIRTYDIYRFNMTVICDLDRCGSVCCIGGYVGLALRDDNRRAAFAFVQEAMYGVFEHLFFPPNKYPYCDITSEQAVRAIDNFLAGRTKTPWKGVL